MAEADMRGVPVPTVKRFPLYLSELEKLKKEGTLWVSATVIARRLGLKAIQVRKDMAYTRVAGIPKRGFPLNELMHAIRSSLGWTRINDAFLVGAGALGSALLGYGGFHERGLNIVSAFDRDPDIVNHPVNGTEVLHIDRFRDLARRMKIKLGIITVPDMYAQDIADLMVESGIRGIWDFSSVRLNLPDSVVVQKEDLSCGLALLSVKLSG
ncbi:MAG: redox-sensing transcriptional repressor Rex [Fibrobacterota bacterium]